MQVTKVKEEFVLSQEAYVLFYAKRGTPWILGLMDPQKGSLDDASVVPDAGSINVNKSTTTLGENNCQVKFKEVEVENSSHEISIQTTPGN